MTDQPTSGSTPPRGSGRLVRIVLVCSLALNLLVIGGVVGSVTRGEKGLRPPPRVEFSASALFSAVDPQDRRDLRREVLRQIGAGENGPRGRRELAQDLLVVLRAEPFDPQALAARLGQESERMVSITASTQTVFVDYVAGLESEARLQLAERLERELTKSRDRDKDDRRSD